MPFENKITLTTSNPGLGLNEPASLAAWTFNIPPGISAISAGTIGGGTVFIEFDAMPTTGTIEIPADNDAFQVDGDPPLFLCAGKYDFPM